MSENKDVSKKLNVPMLFVISTAIISMALIFNIFRKIEVEKPISMSTVTKVNNYFDYKENKNYYYDYDGDEVVYVWYIKSNLEALVDYKVITLEEEQLEFETIKREIEQKEAISYLILASFVLSSFIFANISH